jgi:lipoprotein-releasing system ATP-binding protein
MTESVIELKNVSKIYKDKPVIEGLSLSIKKGEFVGIMGPSGSGKSTTLHIIGGIETPSSGDVNILGVWYAKDGKVLNEKAVSKLRKKYISFIFQFYYLLEDFDVLENVSLFGDKKKAIELLSFLRLDHRLNYKPYELSGGEQQRVAIARALVREPQILIADEPTGNLDYKESHKIFSLLKSLNKESNITIIVATHNEELKPFFDRVIHLG